MSADRIELFDYIEQLRCSVPDVHPAGRMMIHEWLAEMRDAAARDDGATVVKLARMIATKIEHDERKRMMSSTDRWRFTPFGASTIGL